MPVPESLDDLDPVEATNSPQGGDPVGGMIDNYFRAHAMIMKRDLAPALTAAGTAVTPAGGLVATNTQAALEELDSSKQPTGDYATNTALTNGLATKQPLGNYINKGTNNTGADGTVLSSQSLPAFSAAGTGGAAALQINNGGNVSASAGIVFHRAGQYGVIFGLDNDNNLRVGGFSLGAVSYKIWHEGNFSPSSYQPLSGSWNTGNFDPNAKANAGAQTQWNTSVVEFGTIIIGAVTAADCPAPYVMVGLRTAGSSNAAIRGVALRNQ